MRIIPDVCDNAYLFLRTESYHVAHRVSSQVVDAFHTLPSRYALPPLANIDRIKGVCINRAKTLFITVIPAHHVKTTFISSEISN